MRSVFRDWDFVGMVALLGIIAFGVLSLPGCRTLPPECPKEPVKLAFYGETITSEDMTSAYRQCASRFTHYCVEKVEKRPFSLAVSCSYVTSRLPDNY